MDFVGPYDKQAAKQHQSGLFTPLWVGWEFRQRPPVPTDARGWMVLAKTRNWQLTPTQRHDLLTTPLAVIVTGKDQTIQYVNGTFEQMTGYFSHEVIGQRPKMFQGPATSLTSRQHIKEALDQQIPVEEWLINYRKDQTTYGCRIAIWPIVNQANELINFVAFEQETNLNVR